MRLRVAFVVLVACAAGCGNAQHVVTPTTRAATPPAPTGLPVAVVGRLDVHVTGATVTHTTLSRASVAAFVLVSARSTGLPAVARAAAANPGTHYAFVGGSTRAARRSNLTGVVLRDDQAAFLGGVVAALVARDDGGSQRRIAWVGPERRRLSTAFARGAHTVDPSVEILIALSAGVPAACKETALGSTARGAVVIMAEGGGCADAAVAGSHQANHVGLRLADFELPDVAAAQITRNAVAGVFHGGEDVVFGAASGAIGVARLDPRISPTTAIAARTVAQQVASGQRPSR